MLFELAVQVFGLVYNVGSNNEPQGLGTPGKIGTGFALEHQAKPIVSEKGNSSGRFFLVLMTYT